MTKDEELQALREENRTLKALVAQLLPLQEPLAQAQARIKDLEDRLAQDSRTSSKPPSSDGLGRLPRSSRRPSGKRPGGQAGHPGHTLVMVEPPDTVVRHRPKVCSQCCADLSTVPGSVAERRQVLDVPEMRLLAHEHQSEAICCPTCHRTSLGSFPTSVSAPVQYGPHLQALAVYLHQGQLLPTARTCEALAALCGCHIAQATMLQWLHVNCTRSLTHLTWHASRGREAMDEIGIWPRFDGRGMHDRLVSYDGYGCAHSICGAHLGRDCAGVAEQDHQQWAVEMQDFLLDLHDACHEFRLLHLTSVPPIERDDWVARYFEILAAGYAAQPPPAAASSAKRKGRRKQSKAKNLLDALLLRAEQVLALLDDLRIPFTNDVMAYCTPSAWLRCLLKLTLILVMRVLTGRWKQHDPTAISMVHGNASSSPPIPDGLWRHSIGLSGFSS